MPKFVQLHLLTSYPPANLNRDDLGRPKTAMMGGANRLRVSSQSLKRAWRETWMNPAREAKTLDPNNALASRSLRFGEEVIEPELRGQGLEQDSAEKWSRNFQLIFGETEDKGENRLKNKQLAFIAPSEISALKHLIRQCARFVLEGEDTEELFAKVEKASSIKEKKKRHVAIRKLLIPHVLQLNQTAVDIALFGRMLASSPAYNIEAAAQVAHAISVHRVEVEDDYFTAVDDLNDGPEAAHISETEFAAGLFYLYICIDTELLLENLSDDHALTLQTIKALIECAATVAPTGKQNSFASRARASYILCECGNQQPRSLSVAFLKPVTGHDMLATAISALETTRAKMDEAYGDGSQYSACMNVESGQGSLTEIMDCVSKA